MPSNKTSRKASSNPNPSIGILPWGANKKAKTWELIHLAMKKENFRVLFGKKEKNENTSGERKIAVYKRIGAELFPDEV